MADHTVYVVVFVSFGWFFFLGFCLLAMWCFLTKKKKKKKEEKKQKAEVIRRDEHLRVKEDLVKGPKGEEAVNVSIENDERFEEDIINNEKELEEKCMHWRNGGIAATTDIEKGASSSN